MQWEFIMIQLQTISSITSNELALSPLLLAEDLLAAACFADLATFCLGVATADLRFFSGVGLARVWTPASVSASSPAALSLSPVTNTCDPAAVFSLDLRDLTAPGVGLNMEGSAATDLRSDLNSIVEFMLSSCHTTHLLGCFLALTLALSWDKLGAGLLLAVTGSWAACSGSSLLRKSL